MPLTIEENACMEWSSDGRDPGQKIPKIGTSHFSKTIKTKAGAPVLEMSRFQCDSCHVPQVDAKPLVETQFIGVTK
ncbi:MAG: nitrate reductase cytochrome c-type subunit [Betaproteobacteria bacterium]|nr:nitrate reductase cytochrome c-type subunit [Betaproteobacteria bacterium]